MCAMWQDFPSLWYIGVVILLHTPVMGNVLCMTTRYIKNEDAYYFEAILVLFALVVWWELID